MLQYKVAHGTRISVTQLAPVNYMEDLCCMRSKKRFAAESVPDVYRRRSATKTKSAFQRQVVRHPDGQDEAERVRKVDELMQHMPVSYGGLCVHKKKRSAPLFKCTSAVHDAVAFRAVCETHRTRTKTLVERGREVREKVRKTATVTEWILHENMSWSAPCKKGAPGGVPHTGQARCAVVTAPRPLAFGFSFNTTIVTRAPLTHSHTERTKTTAKSLRATACSRTHPQPLPYGAVHSSDRGNCS